MELGNKLKTFSLLAGDYFIVTKDLPLPKWRYAKTLPAVWSSDRNPVT